MASRYFNQFVLTPTKRQVLLSGKIKLDSSAAVLEHDIPFVESVTKTDDGEYTITLQDSYVELRSCQLTMQTSEDVVARIKSHDVSSAKTVVVETATAGAATDVSAEAEIHVTLIFRDSSVGV
jgi:hypothetical protein